MNYRHRANMILVGVFLLFGLATVLRHIYREVFAYKFAFFVLEAALVGGIADWFAITALFRKPLGISYHTALIPRNRQKLIDSIAHMVEDDLLSLEAFRNKIEGINVIHPLISWVDSGNGVEKFGRLVVGLMEDYALGLNPEELSRKLGVFVRTKLGNYKLAQEVSKLGGWILDGHQDEKVLDILLHRLIALARSPASKRKILQLVKDQESEKTKGKFFRSLLADILEATNSLNLEEAAGALHRELVRRLVEIKDSQHPLRLRVKEILRESLDRLSGDLELQNSLEEWKQAVLEDVPLEEALRGLIKAVLDKLASGMLLADWVSVQTNRYWDQFKQDRDLQDWIAHYIKEALFRMVRSEHNLVGNVARETLASFSDEELNGFIEAKAGNDLQWIRVNGSIIGGAVGIVLFLLLNFVYSPLLEPLVQSWLR